jgi:hypothetical protein
MTAMCLHPSEDEWQTRFPPSLEPKDARIPLPATITDQTSMTGGTKTPSSQCMRRSLVTCSSQTLFGCAIFDTRPLAPCSSPTRDLPVRVEPRAASITNAFCNVDLLTIVNWNMRRNRTARKAQTALLFVVAKGSKRLLFLIYT